MLGKRSEQTLLFDVGNVYPLSLPESSFHGQLARAASRLFKDEDFLSFYCADFGRPSVPPSLLALMLILQHEAGVSDEEAVLRTAYDLRWAAVLGRLAGEPLCAKSTFQLFRAHLVLHDAVRVIFLSSLAEAKRAGLLKGKALRLAMDTKPITGRGAVEDTYNLLATGIQSLAAGLATRDRCKVDRWLRSHDLGRYTEPSIKGSADVDWSDQQARDAFLTQIVADARRLLAMAGSDPAVREASELLRKLLLQDVEEGESSDGKPQARIKPGTSRDRIPSATDPEQRHGHKNHSTSFNGSKSQIAVDIDSQIIVATDLLPGNAGDATGTLELVEQAETNTDTPVSESLADCAFGDGDTRQQFADAGRILIAKVPKSQHRNGLFSKSVFTVDPETDTVTCPNGRTTSDFRQDADGSKDFRFGTLCIGCPIRALCTRSPRGRTIRVHPQEAMIQIAREYQATPEGRTHLRERVVVEHRLARLGQLGISQARYIGHIKTEFQLLMASSVANFKRTWNWEQAKRKTAIAAAINARSVARLARIICSEAASRFIANMSKSAATAA